MRGAPPSAPDLLSPVSRPSHAILKLVSQASFQTKPLLRTGEDFNVTSNAAARTGTHQTQWDNTSEVEIEEAQMDLEEVPIAVDL